MADWDWVKIAVQSGAALISGAAGLVIGIWRAGKRSGTHEAEVNAKIKADIKSEFERQLEGMRTEMRTVVADATEDRDQFSKQYSDTFASLRQKINDVELDTERRFLPKESFEKFLEEYRENQRHNSDKLDKLLGLNGARGKQ